MKRDLYTVIARSKDALGDAAGRQKRVSWRVPLDLKVL